MPGVCWTLGISGSGTEFMHLTDYPNDTPPHTHTVLLNHSWGKLSQDKVCEAKYNMHQFDLVREIREGFPEEVIRAKG